MAPGPRVFWGPGATFSEMPVIRAVSAFFRPNCAIDRGHLFSGSGPVLMESRAVTLPRIPAFARVFAVLFAMALLLPGAALAQSRGEAQLQLQIQELQEQIRL